MIDNDTLASIENLHRLKTEGVITEEEFERSKEKLLFGSKPTPRSPISWPLSAPTGGLPDEADHIGWITLPLRRYADFQGRATRKEFWMFQLIYVALLVIGVVFIGGTTDSYGEFSPFGNVVLALIVLAIIGLLVPQTAVQVRRLHDQDRSGWLILLNFIPYVGTLIILVLMILKGTDGDNRFGPDPYNA